jgi:phage gpG-like protein
VRLNPEGTQWKAVIYQVDWKGLQTTRKLDNNLISTIDDDACIQGTRPEYVQYKKQWYVATADYGNRKNEVRLYNPLALAKAKLPKKEFYTKSFRVELLYKIFYGYPKRKCWF